ncbi:unnamed protein product, partial [Hapterophycus canaliculatus]
SLHEAIITRNFEGLSDLLDMGEDPNAGNSWGCPPLVEAAFANSVEMAYALLQAGALLGLGDPRRGATALHVSAREGHLEVTEFLLVAAAAEVADLFDDGGGGGGGGGGEGPEDFATTAAGFAPYSNVIGDGAQTSSRAAANNNRKAYHPPPSVVVNARDSMGMCPLHDAAINARTRVVEALLEAGASVDSRDKRGRTPLFHAVEASAAGAVKALLRAGASPDAT